MPLSGNRRRRLGRLLVDGGRGGRRRVGRRRLGNGALEASWKGGGSKSRDLGLTGEPFGGVAERADKVLEALADRGGVVEAGDDGLRPRDQLVAQLGDPAPALGDQAVGVAAGFEVAGGLVAGLLAKPCGLVLDRVED